MCCGCLQSVDATAVGHIGVCVFYSELHNEIFSQNDEFRKLFLFDCNFLTPKSDAYCHFFFFFKLVCCCPKNNWHNVVSGISCLIENASHQQNGPRNAICITNSFFFLTTGISYRQARWLNGWIDRRCFVFKYIFSLVLALFRFA